MSRLKRDPFLDAIETHASLEDALPHLEALLSRSSTVLARHPERTIANLLDDWFVVHL